MKQKKEGIEMKFRTTQKDIKNSYHNVLSIGYADLGYLLQHRDPEAYTAGVYGWNADIYGIDNTAIVTGYRPFGKHIDYTIVRKYNEKAKKIYDSNYKYQTKVKKLNKLIDEFIEKANNL